MCIAVIGGMDCLDRHYREVGVRLGFDMRIFPRSQTDMTARLRQMDAMVIFTDKVSHRARNEAIRAAKASAIPVFMCHSCGVCSLGDSLNCIAANGKNGGSDA
jgi:hypothetical protein